MRPGGCGFDPRVIPKTFKIVLAALSFALSIEKAELVGPVSVKCDWVRHVPKVCMVCQCGSSLKVSIELPVTARHRRDIIEGLFKATLSLNKMKKKNKIFFFHVEICPMD